MDSRDNIDKIIDSLHRKTILYNRAAYFLLMMSWSIWLVITLIGIVLTTTSLVIQENRLVATILGAVVTALGLIQTKYKPTKRGYLYKTSSLSIRKYIRLLHKLKNSSLSSEEIDKQIESILDNVEDIELTLYEYGTDVTPDASSPNEILVE